MMKHTAIQWIDGPPKAYLTLQEGDAIMWSSSQEDSNTNALWAEFPLTNINIFLY